MENTQGLDTELESLLASAHLRYIDGLCRGYSRKKKGKSFQYQDSHGKVIRDKSILQRIRDLVIPPAWTDVWICPYQNGHLQATGIDLAGRKQYRYHDQWSLVKNQSKFENLIEFGQKLANLRRHLRKDLQLKALNKQKAVAIAISIMDDTFIRVGNSAYEQKYGSYGLTTLKNRHVSIKGQDCFFQFRGKKGVPQKRTLNNKELIRLLRKIKEIPGQTLFQYYNEQSAICQLGSADVNEYLKLHMGKDFTGKDFRTWAGTVLALNCMKEEERLSGKGPKTKSGIVDILNQVAEELGNTRAVTKKYYVHPDLLKIYEDEKLQCLVPELAYCRPKALYKTGEKELLKFLKYLKKTKTQGKRR